MGCLDHPDFNYPEYQTTMYIITACGMSSSSSLKIFFGSDPWQGAIPGTKLYRIYRYYILHWYVEKINQLQPALLLLAYYVKLGIWRNKEIKTIWLKVVGWNANYFIESCQWQRGLYCWWKKTAWFKVEFVSSLK